VGPNSRDFCMCKSFPSSFLLNLSLIQSVKSFGIYTFQPLMAKLSAIQWLAVVHLTITITLIGMVTYLSLRDVCAPQVDIRGGLLDIIRHCNEAPCGARFLKASIRWHPKFLNSSVVIDNTKLCNEFPNNCTAIISNYYFTYY